MRIGIADTMFARVDMAAFALEEVKKSGAEIERYTVPGFKDLPVAAKKLIEEHNCDAVVALAWVGTEEIDERCAMEANIALMNAELMTNKHIIKVFIHSCESKDASILREIAEDRTRKHTQNAIALVKGKTELSKLAGKGQRQGGKHAGEL